ncbi:MAG TPA: hypothetical protein VI389_08035, partial [Geobacteraceae bacterium]
MASRLAVARFVSAICGASPHRYGMNDFSEKMNMRKALRGLLLATVAAMAFVAGGMAWGQEFGAGAQDDDTPVIVVGGDRD